MKSVFEWPVLRKTAAMQLAISHASSNITNHTGCHPRSRRDVAADASAPMSNPQSNTPVCTHGSGGESERDYAD